jgi:hypothetical protein
MLRPLRACERATQVQVLGKAWTACRRRGIFSCQCSPALAPVAGSYWPSIAVLRRQETSYSLGGLVPHQDCVTSDTLGSRSWSPTAPPRSRTIPNRDYVYIRSGMRTILISYQTDRLVR